MKRWLVPWIVPAALGWNAAAQAQAQVPTDALQPGLWEFKQQMQWPGRPDMGAQMAQLQQQMKNLPPEVRQKVEQQMASKGMALGDDGAMRICITPEQAKAGPMQMEQGQGQCAFTKTNRSGNTWTGHMVCKQPPSEGDFTTTLHGPTHFSTKAVLTSQQHGRIEMQTEARRLGGDCGMPK